MSTNLFCVFFLELTCWWQLTLVSFSLCMSSVSLHVRRMTPQTQASGLISFCFQHLKVNWHFTWVSSISEVSIACTDQCLPLTGTLSRMVLNCCVCSILQSAMFNIYFISWSDFSEAPGNQQSTLKVSPRQGLSLVPSLSFLIL